MPYFQKPVDPSMNTTLSVSPKNLGLYISDTVFHHSVLKPPASGHSKALLIHSLASASDFGRISRLTLNHRFLRSTLKQTDSCCVGVYFWIAFPQPPYTAVRSLLSGLMKFDESFIMLHSRPLTICLVHLPRPASLVSSEKNSLFKAFDSSSKHVPHQ